MSRPTTSRAIKALRSANATSAEKYNTDLGLLLLTQAVEPDYDQHHGASPLQRSCPTLAKKMQWLASVSRHTDQPQAFLKLMLNTTGISPTDCDKHGNTLLHHCLSMPEANKAFTLTLIEQLDNTSLLMENKAGQSTYDQAKIQGYGWVQKAITDKTSGAKSTKMPKSRRYFLDAIHGAGNDISSSDDESDNDYGCGAGCGSAAKAGAIF